MPQISVIVPVYNVEKYLVKCVDSILAQTYEDLEIILVDDGSPDKSAELCDELALRDPRIRVLHKQNGGLSSARNAGMAVARGKYIGFVDSDDYVDPRMYEKLYNALIKYDADICICNYVYVNEKTGNINEEMRLSSPIIDEVFDRAQALEKLNASVNGYSFYVTAWNKLYKRSLFEDCVFPEGRIHEDEFIIHHLFGKCNCIVSLADTLYSYVQREGSITNTKLTIKTMDVVYALYDRYQFFAEEGREDLAGGMLDVIYWRISTLVPHLQKDSQEIVNVVMRKILPELIKRKIVLAGRLVLIWCRYLWKTK